METEQFFGNIGSFLKKAAPILKKVAKVAAPIVGTAIAGPAGAALGNLAVKAWARRNSPASSRWKRSSSKRASRNGA